MRRSVVILAVALGSLTLGAQDRSPQPFRTEANYIRVDMYPTVAGRPVDDLQASEVEITDQGVPQKIDRFERIRRQIPGTAPQAAVSREPATVAAAATPAPDSPGRIFVLFLDSNHVDGNWARGISPPLIKALNNLIREDDLIAVMTADMDPRNLTFTPRTSSIENVLRQNWGRDRRMDLTPEETEFYNCYPGKSLVIAQEMILRRREQLTFDALDALVDRLAALQRDERKAVVTISYGWRMFEDAPELRGGSSPAPPPAIGPNPTTGRLTVEPSERVGATPRCESARLSLSMLRSEPRFRDMLDRANRTNTSFYPIDPRRVVVFDEDPIPAACFGPCPPIDLTEDRARLNTRHDALLRMADYTDGIAVVFTSDIDASFQRINDDLSSYYLLGFYSTQKPDGKFHKLSVRVKRKGVEVRARRGYLASTAVPTAPASAAARSGAAAAAGAVSASTASAVQAALAALSALGRERPLRAQVAARTGDNVSRIWAVVESQTVAGRNDWSEGAQADIALVDATGKTVTTERVPVPRGMTSVRVELHPEAPLAPGEYQLQVGAKGLSAGALSSTETVQFSIPQGAAGIGALFTRRGPTTGNRDLPTADLRFRRTERVVMEIPALSDNAGTARILDRAGNPLAVPATTAVRTDSDGTRWRTVQITLAPLAPADYVVSVTAGTENALVAIRVLP
ncbi:MAG TPA: VWA domain-containing protein [Vicinamibacterales bacterium]|nr:VWA domain-containing protein [Vicinamibacterales bacterium]